MQLRSPWDPKLSVGFYRHLRHCVMLLMQAGELHTTIAHDPWPRWIECRTIGNRVTCMEERGGTFERLVELSPPPSVVAFLSVEQLSPSRHSHVSNSRATCFDIQPKPFSLFQPSLQVSPIPQHVRFSWGQFNMQQRFCKICNSAFADIDATAAFSRGPKKGMLEAC